MLRRSLTVLAAAACLAAAAPTAIAAVVHVRIEGRTTTIFGATEPRASAANALEALQAASTAGEFYYHLTTASFGTYVDQIGLYPAAGAAGWVYKVNGVSPQVGADKTTVKDGDTVLWYWAEFGPSGGPKTLVLRRSGRCYRVVAQDDSGATTPAAGASLHVDGRTVKAPACFRSRHGLVRATAPGAVRSNVLP